MAKAKKKSAPKSKAPKAKPAAKASKSVAPKAAPTKIAAPSGDRIELSMLASRPHLQDRMREAFRSQCSDAHAERLGGETKSAGVLAESRKWCAIIEHTLSYLRPGQVVRYSADRLTWLLENVADLADTIASESGRAQAAGAAAGSAAVAEQRARAVRNDMVLALTEIADGNDGLEAELSVARGEATRPADVLTSLRSLSDLGTRWATSFDPTVHALTESVGLTRADLTAALAAADALADALGGKATTAPRTGRDSAGVNRIEGRVLFEMGKAMAPVNDAADHGIGQALTPGPATAAVLSTRKRKARETAPVPAPSPPGAG